MNLENIHIPEDPILCSGPMRDIVRHGVPPRWNPPVGSEKVPVTGLELDLRAVANGLPLDGGVEPPRHALHHLAARDAEEQRLVGRRQVFSVTALESDDVVELRNELHRPLGVAGGSVAVLRDGLLVLVGQEVFVVVAAEAHRLRAVEELHAGTERGGGGVGTCCCLHNNNVGGFS